MPTVSAPRRTGCIRDTSQHTHTHTENLGSQGFGKSEQRWRCVCVPVTKAGMEQTRKWSASRCSSRRGTAGPRPPQWPESQGKPPHPTSTPSLAAAMINHVCPSQSRPKPPVCVSKGCSPHSCLQPWLSSINSAPGPCTNSTRSGSGAGQVPVQSTYQSDLGWTECESRQRFSSTVGDQASKQSKQATTRPAQHSGAAK